MKDMNDLFGRSMNPMSSRPDRVINSNFPPVSTSPASRRLASLKGEFRGGIVSDMRRMLKENTFQPVIKDLQSEVLAFGIRRYKEYLGSTDDDPEMNERMRLHIFDDTWSLLMGDFLHFDGDMGTGARKVALSWYDGFTLATDPTMMEMYVDEYYANLESDLPLRPADILDRFLTIDPVGYSSRIR